MGIVYDKKCKDPNKIVAWSDASYADDFLTGRSTWGSMLMLNGGPIMWKSVMSDWVLLSSTHAEYGAINLTGLAVWYAANLLADITGDGVQCTEIFNNSPDRNSSALKEFQAVSKGSLPVDVMVDNQAAIHIGSFDGSGKRAKHINVRYQHVKMLVNEGICVLKYVKTTDQLADIFTKCLGRNAFIYLRNKILREVLKFKGKK